MMKKTMQTVILSTFLCSSAFASDTAMVEQGRAASKALGGTLKQELQKAVKEGDAGAALTVCNEKAPEIAAQISKEQQLQVGRTALRVRNPANAPDAWEKEQLETFIKRLASGESAQKMEAHTVENGTFRYMKAIPMQGMCMTCHGDQELIPDNVKERLATLYPDDQATGFTPGSLRGAFTISILPDTAN